MASRALRSEVRLGSWAPPDGRQNVKITFSITLESTRTPEAICWDIFDFEQWSSFEGYGPVPAIRKATGKASQSSIIGTEVYVENMDGSQHVETIESFEAYTSLVMRISDFSSPLRYLATHFIERWDLSQRPATYRVTRTFELYPRNALAFPLLWIVSRFLSKAVEIHTRHVANPRVLT